MKTVEEVRRARLALLVEEFKSLAKLNEKLGRIRTDSTLSQYANQSEGSKTKKLKTMGSATARALEAACDKEHGWMDTDPDVWPFGDLDHSKMMALPSKRRDQIEGAILALADQIGVDIRKTGTA